MSNDTYDLEALSDLAIQLGHAKAREEIAKAERIALEEQIAVLIPGAERGQKTVTLPNGTKITVERGLNYKADFDKMDSYFKNQLDNDFPAPIKTKTTREIDEKGYAWYLTEQPAIFKAISEFVTVTPKKTAVSLKVK